MIACEQPRNREFLRSRQMETEPIGHRTGSDHVVYSLEPLAPDSACGSVKKIVGFTHMGMLASIPPSRLYTVLTGHPMLMHISARGEEKKSLIRTGHISTFLFIDWASLNPRFESAGAIRSVQRFSTARSSTCEIPQSPYHFPRSII